MNSLMLVAAGLSGFAAVAHVGCIVFGAPWYRFFGAGEQMAVWAEQGDIRATFITSGIVAVLSIWSLYALSGAGVIGRLPLLRIGLCVITGVYLFRGIAGFFLMGAPLGRTPEFWLYSSIICLGFGLIHFFAVKQSWSQL